MSKIRLTKFAKVLLSLCLMATTIYNTPIVISATEDETIAETTTLDESTTMDSTAEESSSSNVSEETSEQVQENIEQPSPVESEVVPTVTPEEIITTVEPTVAPSKQPVETIPTEVVPTETPVATQLPEDTGVSTELPVETLLPELNEDDRLLLEDEPMLSDLNSNIAKVYPEYLTPQELSDGGYGEAHLDASNSGFFEIKDGKYICINERNYPKDYPHGKHYVSITSNATANTIGYVRCDVYSGETSEDIYFEVIYELENGDVISRESVKENDVPAKVPDYENGYWTLKGGQNQVTPNNVHIKENRTTFVWHKAKGYKVTYKWDGEIPPNGVELPVDENEYLVGAKYLINKDYDSNTVIDDKDENGKVIGKYLFYGWKDLNNGVMVEGGVEVAGYWGYKKVEPSESAEANLQDVYVYVQITGYPTTSLKPNKDGWYTVGQTKMDLVDINEVEHGYDLIDNNKVAIEDAKAAISSKNFKHYEHNQALNTKLIAEHMNKNNVDIKKVTNGATDYVEIGNTWHMDIVINYYDVQDKMLKIVYEDGVDNEEVFENRVYEELNGNPTPKFDLNLDARDGFQDPIRKGYTFDGWEPNVKVTVDEEDATNGIITYKAKWKINSSDFKTLTYTVHYFNDGDEVLKDQQTVTQKVWVNAPDTLTVDKTRINITNKYDGYAFDKTDPSEIPSTIQNGGTIKVYYEKDVEGGEKPGQGDGTPDKYQVTVTYKVDNGTWNDGTETTLTQEYVIGEKDGAGNWTANKVFLSDIPTPKPAEGFTDEGKWITDEPNEEIQVTKNVEYKYAYDQKVQLSAKVNFVNEDTKEPVKDSINVNVVYGTDLVAANYVESIQGYVVTDATQVVENIKENGKKVTIFYAEDVEGGEKPGQGDGTPDKYQAKVVFSVVNGNFKNSNENQRETYVTLFEDGEWSENGIGYLSDEQAAYGSDVVANDGYVGPLWDPDVPHKSNEISKDGMKYVATFALPKYNVTIKYVNEKSEPIAETKYFAINKEEVVEQVSPEVDGYALLDPSQSIVVVKGEDLSSDYVVTVAYGVDSKGTIDPETGEDKGDGIADKYQVDVIFAAVNGVFIENGKAQLEKLVTLVDENGNFSDKGTFILSDYMLPKARPVGTYTGVGSWDHLLPNKPQSTVITKEGPFTFTITFNQKLTSDITVNTYYEGVENAVTSKATQEVGTKFTHDFTDVVTYEDNHYVLESVNPGETITVDASDVNNVIDAYYVLDNDGGKEPGEGDGTPDKYQVKVTYEVVNGTVSFAETFVTLYKAGVMAEDGIGYLTEEQIPTFGANSGYHFVKWNPEKPTVEVEITEDTVFTAYYEADASVEPERKDPVFQCPDGTVWNDETGMCEVIVVSVPVDPGNPPVGPVNPGNLPADMTTPDDGDDQNAEIVETPFNDDDNTGKGEVVEIEDEETPEAGGRRGHWALINLIATVGGALLALILLIGKHQKDADDEADENAQVVASEMDEEDEVVKRRRKWKYISTIVAVISVVIFFLTENMSLRMVLVDKYTMLMLALFLGNVVCLYMGKRWHEADEEEQERA